MASWVSGWRGLVAQSGVQNLNLPQEGETSAKWKLDQNQNQPSLL
jgi:hypothetical protein